MKYLAILFTMLLISCSNDDCKECWAVVESTERMKCNYPQGGDVEEISRESLGVLCPDELIKLKKETEAHIRFDCDENPDWSWVLRTRIRCEGDPKPSN